MMHEIQATHLTSSRALNCPSCGKTVLLVHPDRTEVPAGKYWLDDGDRIPGIWAQLTDLQRTPDGSDCALMIGHCAQCGEGYYVILASFMNATEADVGEYLRFNMPFDAERNVLCKLGNPIEGVPAHWIMQEYETPLGLMQTHIFGTWRLDDLGLVSGPWGVSSCRDSGVKSSPWDHGRALLLTIWDPLRALHPGLSAQCANLDPMK